MVGLRALHSEVHIIGCQHAVIPLSEADMFMHPKEKNLKNTCLYFFLL
jgi:hypothetical protein